MIPRRKIVGGWDFGEVGDCGRIGDGMLEAFEEGLFSGRKIAELRSGGFRAFTERILGRTNKWFHLAVIEELDKCSKRLLILMPPGFGKSTIASVSYPLYRLTADRDLRILIISNTVGQAKEWLRQIEAELLLNQSLREIYGNLVPDPRTLTWTDTEKIVVGRSPSATHLSLLALGVQGNLRGRRFDLIIADDLLDLENSSTAIRRAGVSSWFWNELLPRLEPEGSLIVIGTRLHPEDLYAELMALDWPVLRFAALEDGESIWPERFPTEELLERKRSMGSVLFQLQYMNDPSGLAGAILKREWLSYTEDIPENLEIFFGVDLSLSSKPEADYFVIAVVGVEPKTKLIYLLELIRTQAELLRQIELLKYASARWSPRLVGIESNAAQILVPQLLEAQTNIPIKKLFSQSPKEFRYLQMSALFEARRVMIRGSGNEPLVSLKPFVDEWLEFPRGKHDDCLEAVSKALELAIGGGVELAFSTGASSDIIRPEPRVLFGRKRWAPIRRSLRF